MRACATCKKDIQEGDRHLVLALFEQQAVSHPDSNPGQPFQGWRFCSEWCLQVFQMLPGNKDTSKEHVL